MREILFRGKRVGNGEWIFGSLIDDGGDCHIAEKEDIQKAFLVYPESVGQFTGMRDTSGQKVFEGDIIVPTKPSNIPPLEVVFDVAEGQFAVRECRKYYHGTLATFGRITDNHYKVIGNMWDNPELLEVDE